MFVVKRYLLIISKTNCHSSLALKPLGTAVQFIWTNFLAKMLAYGGIRESEREREVGVLRRLLFAKWKRVAGETVCVSHPSFLVVCFYSAIDPFSPRGLCPHPLDRSSRAPRRRQREVLGARSLLLSGHRKRLRTEIESL
ncbi:hypothetical protein KSP40_PGU022016 [Platanthera guangdongensis]|uniref:Uncharacterized protein n=1 Tax=Platanthera guangdongensis TaxID=2320717 RepID=A0ABR2LM84_9ASPA